MSDKKQKKSASYRPKKRKFQGNRFTGDDDIEKTSTASKKIKSGDPDFSVTVHPTAAYVLVHWTLFIALEQSVSCKTCKKNVEFGVSNSKGLGFQLEVMCECKQRKSIPSSPKIKNGYEINRRIIYVMRLLGVGFTGLLNFCGLMDISLCAFSANGYYKCLQHIYAACEAVSTLVFKKAAQEEQEKNQENGHPANKLTVSGDGSWPKRGFTALLGIVSLIGKYSNKILDAIVKSKICHACNQYAKKFPENSPEFEAWFTEHCEKGECKRDHDGSAGLIESEGVQEMFSRSKKLHNVMYEYYIGDGDSKTFKHLQDLKPYGDEVEVKKKACVLHVGKAVYRRGKEAKKRMAQEKRAQKKALQAQEEKSAGGSSEKKSRKKKVTHLK